MLYQATIIKDGKNQQVGIFRTPQDAIQEVTQHAPEDVAILISPMKLEYQVTIDNIHGKTIFADVVSDAEVERTFADALTIAGHRTGTIISVELL